MINNSNDDDDDHNNNNNNNNNSNNSNADSNKLIYKDNDNDNDDENNAQNKDNKKHLKNRVYVMIILNNNIYNQNSYRGNTNNTYLLYPNHEETTLSNMQRKHHVH